jgi:hypothetical protein
MKRRPLCYVGRVSGAARDADGGIKKTEGCCGESTILVISCGSGSGQDGGEEGVQDLGIHWVQGAMAVEDAKGRGGVLGKVGLGVLGDDPVAMRQVDGGDDAVDAARKPFAAHAGEKSVRGEQRADRGRDVGDCAYGAAESGKDTIVEL